MSARYWKAYDAAWQSVRESTAENADRNSLASIAFEIAFAAGRDFERDTIRMNVPTTNKEQEK